MKGSTAQKIRKFSRHHKSEDRLQRNKFPEHKEKSRSTRLLQRCRRLFRHLPKVGKGRGVTQEAGDEGSPPDATDAAADAEDRGVARPSHDICVPHKKHEDESQQPLTVRKNAAARETLVESKPTIRAVRVSTEPADSLMPVDALDHQSVVPSGPSSTHEKRLTPRGERKPPPVKYDFKGAESSKWELFGTRRSSVESMRCEKAAREEAEWQAKNMF
ncbi:uncharacterized protein MAM_08290 [Metarhizium album ARSEF 1941]|uniref:Uncharacterized protein n=1 Tax=Metarhizium album (strain ARSEF 1941) TaxID=1081103 RepID=A0A0B2WJ26_METAS|nr:uncharacterized protein MAM_08290 [Metarhizium album ARSEF 1941]KHN93868.1 hypothetical protein MAM_08290 [Metarhizium album ARSEF 1941]